MGSGRQPRAEHVQEGARGSALHPVSSTSSTASASSAPPPPWATTARPGPHTSGSSSCLLLSLISEPLPPSPRRVRLSGKRLGLVYMPLASCAGAQDEACPNGTAICRRGGRAEHVQVHVPRRERADDQPAAGGRWTALRDNTGVIVMAATNRPAALRHRAHAPGPLRPRHPPAPAQSAGAGLPSSQAMRLYVCLAVQGVAAHACLLSSSLDHSSADPQPRGWTLMIMPPSCPPCPRVPELSECGQTAAQRAARIADC